ncbi:hypothetical protein ABZ419_11315 [Streptomyces cinnamoneus]|uniref:hypothetical protein n=1 Tax=Streptomyces cinnamoneus TaxID=53446 RepID=UPI0033C51921
MTDTAPAAVLRAAADRLRDLATAAIHEDRAIWTTGYTLGSRTPVVLDNPESPSVLIETYAARLERVNAFVAAMDPASGLTLADLLDDLADGDDEGVINPYALAVARLLIDEGTGHVCS